MGVSLTRTAGTPTSKKKFTFSLWYKKTTIRDYGASTHDGCFFNSASSNDNRLTFMINQENSPYDQVRLVGRNSGSQILDLRTNAILRDPSAWYHIVAKVDTTQNTNTDRAKLYINGTEQTLDTSSYPNQDVELEIHHTPYLLSYSGIGNYVEGLITHYHYTDGYAYDASTFGETDSTSGIWKPKTAPSVTYGTNGFFLKFENSGAMGTDSSGNGNNFTVSGTLTQSVDTPSNNFATGNPLYFTNSAWTTSLSNGNLTVTGHSGTNSYPVLASTLAVSAGKFYAEFKVTSSSQNFYCGVATPEAVSGTSINAHYPNWNNEGGSNAHAYSIYGADGLKYVKENGGSTASSSYAGTTSQNDIIGIALDLDNNKLYFHKNGTYFNSGVPTSGSTGTGAISIINHDYLFFFSDGGGSTDASGQANFGSGYFGTTAISSAGTAPSEGGIFEYDCPSGYQALCTKAINSF